MELIAQAAADFINAKFFMGGENIFEGGKGAQGPQTIESGLESVSPQQMITIRRASAPLFLISKRIAQNVFFLSICSRDPVMPNQKTRPCFSSYSYLSRLHSSCISRHYALHYSNKHHDKTHVNRLKPETRNQNIYQTAARLLLFLFYVINL